MIPSLVETLERVSGRLSTGRPVDWEADCACKAEVEGGLLTDTGVVSQPGQIQCVLVPGLRVNRKPMGCERPLGDSTI
jgi:hypothetical protein